MTRNIFAKFVLGNSLQAGPIILVYHAIRYGYGSSKQLYSLDLDRFVQHLNLLKFEGLRSARVCDLDSSLGTNHAALAISFDDGYADNYRAFEALNKFGFKATFFVVSGSLGRRASWDKWSEGKETLSKDKIRFMAASGMEIGSHGRRHIPLTQLNNRDLKYEVEGSKQDLEDVLGYPIESFAYPYGDCDDRVAAAVRRAGYAKGCTTASGRAWVGNSDFFLRRLTIESRDNAIRFAVKIALATNDGRIRNLLSYFLRKLIVRGISSLFGKYHSV